MTYQPHPPRYKMPLLRKTLLYTFLILLFPFVIFLKNFHISQEISEWKEVPQGYAIKADEIAQLNLNSGKNYVKKLNTKIDDTSNSDIAKASQPIFGNKIDDKSTQPETLVRDKFRSMEELQKELGPLFESIKSDSQIMNELYTVINNNTNALTDRISALENLESLLSDIDNAVNLIKVDGYKVLFTILNESLNETCKVVAKNLFSAIQNNPDVQLHMVKINGLNHVIDMLNRIFDSRTLPKNCIQKMVSTFSAMLRGCLVCFKSFATNNPPYDLIKKLILYKNYEIRHKVLYMLISVYHSAIESNDIFSSKDFENFINGANLCPTILSGMEGLQKFIEDAEFFHNLSKFSEALCGKKVLFYANL